MIMMTTSSSMSLNPPLGYGLASRTTTSICRDRAGFGGFESRAGVMT